MVRGAKRMVPQHLDDPAVGDLAARALHHHAFKLGLEGRQPREAAFDFDKLRPRNGICGCAGLIGVVREAEKVADRLECEPQVARVPDEGKPVECLRAIEPLIAGAALGLGQKADLLVVADRRHLDPRLCPELSDRQHQIPLEAIVARDIRYLIR